MLPVFILAKPNGLSQVNSHSRVKDHCVMGQRALHCRRFDNSHYREFLAVRNWLICSDIFRLLILRWQLPSPSSPNQSSVRMDVLLFESVQLNFAFFRQGKPLVSRPCLQSRHLLLRLSRIQPFFGCDSGLVSLNTTITIPAWAALMSFDTVIFLLTLTKIISKCESNNPT